MNKRIFLVEDSPDDVALAVRAFRRNGLQVELDTAASGEEALAALLAADSTPDLIVLDLQLPRMNGLDVLRRLRAEPSTRRLPVVVMTSSDLDQDIAASYDAGANSFLRKPVDFADFVSLVGQLSRYWLELNRIPGHG